MHLVAANITKLAKITQQTFLLENGLTRRVRSWVRFDFDEILMPESVPVKFGSDRIKIFADFKTLTDYRRHFLDSPTIPLFIRCSPTDERR